MKLKAPNHGEVNFLAAEIFLMATYGPQLSKRNPVILDCGANCGFATAFFKLLHPEAEITAFEPAPKAFAILKSNVEVNGLTNVELVQAACGNSDGVLSFVENDRLSLISSSDPVRGEGRVLNVPVVRVSKWVNGVVDLLKIDVEGAEHEVMDDLIESGAISRVDRLAIEYHHRMQGAACKLGPFLTKLENAGFSYSLLVSESSGVRFGAGFQDTMIYAYRPRLTFPC